MAKKKNQKKKQQPSQQNQKKQQSNLPAILFFSISGLAIIGFLIFLMINSTGSNNQGTASQTEPLEFNATLEGQPSLGDENAPITIVEIGDYKCIHCKDFHQNIFSKLKKDFIDTGKVQFYFVNFPFIDEDSARLARGGETVFAQNPEAFWEYHNLVFEQEYKDGELWATEEAIVKLVEDKLPAVDAKKFKQEFEDNAYVSKVNEDLSIVKETGVTSTPTVFINGKEFQQWYDYEAFKAELERLLKDSEGK